MMTARYMQRTKDLAMKWGEWAVLSTALGLYTLCSPAVTGVQNVDRQEVVMATL